MPQVNELSWFYIGIKFLILFLVLLVSLSFLSSQPIDKSIPQIIKFNFFSLF